MRMQRDKRLQAERTKTIKSRYQELDKIVTSYQRTHYPQEFFVNTLDVCESPGVSESIIGTSDEVFQECLAGIPDRIPEIHALAHQKRQEEVLKLLPEGSTASVLPLAVSWFRCRYCSQSFHYAVAITHCCYMWRAWSYKTYEELTAMEPLEQVHHLYGRGMWTADRIVYWKDAAELTKQVIEAVGTDSNTTAPDELDDAKHRFVVFTGSGSSTMTIVSWRCLVSCQLQPAPFLLSEWLNEDVNRSRTGLIKTPASAHRNGGS